MVQDSWVSIMLHSVLQEAMRPAPVCVAQHTSAGRSPLC